MGYGTIGIGIRTIHTCNAWCYDSSIIGRKDQFAIALRSIMNFATVDC